MKPEQAILKSIRESFQADAKVYIHKETGEPVEWYKHDPDIMGVNDPWAEEREKVASNPDS
jgi:hypothetical protein